MLSSINSTMKKIWKKMARKAYRDSFVAAHISNTVSAQIAKLREKEGWTQTRLAEHCGMRQSRISALEDPNYENYEIKTLRRIASTFDVGLIVRFVPFSEIARWTTELSEESLVVPKFEDDQPENARAQVPMTIIAEYDRELREKIMFSQRTNTTELEKKRPMHLGALFPNVDAWDPYRQEAPSSEIPKMMGRLESSAAFQRAQQELH